MATSPQPVLEASTVKVNGSPGFAFLVKNEGETVKGTPHYLRSMPKSKKDYDGEFAKKLNCCEGHYF